MRSLIPSLSNLLLALIALQALAFEALALRVYPVGDSITHGTTTAGGYRSPLYQKLTAAGYDVDMVGSVQDFADRVLTQAGERHHDGHSGWTITQIDRGILGWLKRFEAPDVILIHIGTNDFRGGTTNKRAIDQLDALITKIATATPDSHIIVTNLMERGGSANTHIQNDFNPFVEEKIAGQAALGRKVSFLDMRAAVPISDMPDRLHPNAAGLRKMADAYYGAVLEVVGPPFKITSLELSDVGNESQAVLTWNSQPGRSYVIQVSEDQNDWMDLQFSVASAGAVTSGAAAIPPGALATYFRVREGLPSENLLSGSTLQWLVPGDATLEATWDAIVLPDDAGFIDGTGTGVGFETRPGAFDPFIHTNVLEAMLPVNASIYLRYGFSIPANRRHQTLTLSMRYDDGFVAYLNGTEIASRNAPAEIGWDAKATSGHPDKDAIVFEEIDVFEFVGLLRPGENNVLAVQGLNKSAGGSDFLIEPRLSGEFQAAAPTPEEK